VFFIKHEVIYYKSCETKEMMDLMKRNVLYKMNEYRECANRDRFILPIDKDIKFFTDIYDEVFDYLNKKN
jgi:hypothetical protein